MMYLITERIVVDTEVGFDIDIDRCVELVNQHRNVAVGSFEDAVAVLSQLGFTDASIEILINKATILPEEAKTLPPGEQDALPR